MPKRLGLNMELKYKTVSVDTAKKLDAAGFTDETERYWTNTVGQVDQTCWRIEYNTFPFDEYIEQFAAPDAEEILEQLPCSPKDNWYLELDHDFLQGYSICYRSELKGDKTPTFRHKGEFRSMDNLAEACAGMWLYLKEINII